MNARNSKAVWEELPGLEDRFLRVGRSRHWGSLGDRRGGRDGLTLFQSEQQPHLFPGKETSTHPPSFPSGLIAGHRALLERVVITCHATSDERVHVPFSHVYETEVVPAPSTSPTLHITPTKRLR